MLFRSKTEVTEKQDKRTDKDVREEVWHEKREDVDVKKDVDVVHRYPEIWNTASLADCNEKKKIIFNNRNTVETLREQVKNLTVWVNSIMPSRFEIHSASITPNNPARYPLVLRLCRDNLRFPISEVKLRHNPNTDTLVKTAEDDRPKLYEAGAIMTVITVNTEIMKYPKK